MYSHIGCMLDSAPPFEYGGRVYPWMVLLKSFWSSVDRRISIDQVIA